MINALKTACRLNKKTLPETGDRTVLKVSGLNVSSNDGETGIIFL